MKKFIKYTSRTVLGLFTIFLGLVIWGALTPDESYHHCESGQEEWSVLQGAMVFAISLIIFFVVWYKTRKW